MNNFVKKNVIFRLISGFVMLMVTSLMVFFFVETIKVNKSGDYVINLFGLGGMTIFSLIETILLFKNCKKSIIFHPIIFNEHNSTINWPAFIVDNIGLAIGLAIEIVSLILFSTTKDLIVKTSTMVLIPLGAFLIVNCLIYNVHLILFMERKIKIKDLIK